MSIILQTMRGVSGGLTQGLRALALSILLLDVLYAYALALLASWIAAHGSWIPSVLAACLAVVLSVVVGTIIAIIALLIRQLPI